MNRPILILLSLLSIHCINAQQIDPALTSAVLLEQQTLKKIYEDRHKTENKIIAAETALTLSLDRLHQVEDKMLSYLSNAQVAVQNLYQIKRAAELVATEIPNSISFLTSGIPSHLKGTAIAAVASRRIKDATTQMASLYPFVQQLVTSGSYNVSDYDSNGNYTTQQHKVNLLNSAERYYVANEIVTRLESINTSLYLLGWQIRTMTLSDLWYNLDPKGWARAVNTKAISETIIYKWKHLK